MKSKHDKSNSSGMKNAHDEDDSQSENGDRSRSTSRNHTRIKDSKNSGTSSDKLDHDSLSIYIGNVDYGATEDELKNTFIDCGDIVRVTIIKNMKTGHPKGAAFIEFTDKEGVNAALNMNGKPVKGRPLIVTSKKPRPENRQRDTRPHYYNSSYERRPPMDRSGMPMYQMYPPSGRPSYSAGPSRGGYYMSDHGMDRRGGLPMQMPMDLAPPRYDPYRRPDFYDPYMMQRGSQMPPQPYYHHSSKISGSSNGSNSSGSRNQQQPPVRYSNTYNRR